MWVRKAGVGAVVLTALLVAQGVQAQTGPAPAGVQAAPTSSSSVIVSWTRGSGVAGYAVGRNCTGVPPTGSCQAMSGSLAATVASWSDTGLTPSTSYSYRVAVRYLDGRIGVGDATVTTPAMVSAGGTSTGGTASMTTDNVISMTACEQRRGGRPGPSGLKVVRSLPTGAWLGWAPEQGTVWVVDRALDDGTNQWQRVASSCPGAPQPLRLSGLSVEASDRLGVVWNARYVYKVTAITDGRAGWSSLRWGAPPEPLVTVVSAAQVTGTSSVSIELRWGPPTPNLAGPDAYVVTADFGPRRWVVAQGGRLMVEGVPIGTSTYTAVAEWAGVFISRPTTFQVTVAP